MKKNGLGIIIAFFITSTAWACEPPTPPTTQTQNQTQTQTAVGIGVGIAQVGDVTATGGQGGNASLKNSVEVNTPRQVLPALPVITQPFSLLNGRIGEMEGRRSIYMRKCGKNDDIVNVVEVNDGGIFSAIRYKEVNAEIISTIRKYTGDSRNLCYWVGYNESSSGGGVGGGATGAMSSGNSFMSTGAAIIPGYNAATFNPKFFIEVDEVIPATVSMTTPVIIPSVGPADKGIISDLFGAAMPQEVNIHVDVSARNEKPEAKKPAKKKWWKSKGRCVKWEK